MNKEKIETLKERPLFSLTVDDFIQLQNSIVKKEETQLITTNIIGIEDAVIITGYKKSTLYRKTSEKAIPFHKRGN